MRCILKKISTNKNNLRGGEITGECDYLPVMDQSFTCYSRYENLADTSRMVVTSIVKTIQQNSDSLYTFDTLNSTYTLEILKD